MHRRRIMGSALGGLAALSMPGVLRAESLAERSASTRRVAEHYFQAYIARDWASLEPWLDAGGVFTDPTAEPVFGRVEHRGKPAVMTNFREGYAAITSMAFAPSRVFVSGAFAVFEGTLDWTLELGGGAQAVTRHMPFLTILRVQAGRVVEHTDYADYQPFVEAVRRARSQG